MAIDEMSDETDLQYQASVADLIGRTLTIWYRTLKGVTLLFGIGLLALSFVIIALLALLFLNPELAFFMSFDAFGFVLRIPAVPSIILFNVLTLFLSTIIWSIIEGPTTHYIIDHYEQKEHTIDTAIVNARPRIFTLLKARLIILLIEMMVIIPVIFLLIWGFSTGDISVVLTAEMLSLMIVMIVGYIHVRFLPIAPIILKENITIRKALQRSFDLSSGLFIHVMVGFLGLLFFEFMIFFFLANIFVFLAPFGYVGALMPFYVSFLLMGSLRPIFNVVVYKDLRSRIRIRKT